MIPDKVRTILEKHGLEALEFEPGSTPTAETAAARIGVSVGQIAKTIMVRGKDKTYRLVVLPGDRKLSSARLKSATGVKHSMASAEEIQERTGFRPGGVCPFGVDGIEILIDSTLRSYDTIYPAAGNDATGVPMTFDQLREICGGTICDLSQD